MRSVVILTALIGLPAANASLAQAPPSPPMPSPVRSPVRAAPRVVRPPEITLGERRDSITPDVHGAAQIEKGAITVAATGGRLEAALAGAAHAHAYFFCHATGRATLHLEQEFKIGAGDPATSGIPLLLAATIEGYLRSDESGAACLREASAAVYPACGGGPVAALSFSPGCVVGCGNARYSEKAQLPPQLVPPGTYVLVATFVFDANVDGFCHGHGEAVFTPDDPFIVPSLANNPFEKLDRKDFGFRITVQID